MHDDLFREPRAEIDPFDFNDDVANVFDDMAARSIPGYQTFLDLGARLLAANRPPRGNIYDLGASTGTFLLHLDKHLPAGIYTLTGIDNSESMVDKATHKLSGFRTRNPIKFVYDDILAFEYYEVVAFTSFFTLQFVKPAARNKFVRELCMRLPKNGILLVAEKIELPGRDLDEAFINLYYDFKKKNAYSDLEIAQKREALENVLIPDSIDAHIERLKMVGFSQVSTYYQWLNFAGFIAIK
jgi:tRNA (cmo5U34)-methyltransferase